eukprot:Hpha_TRINITY_DN11722_c0_g1::TRINITY_DN11722_c0_g1_i1::g.31871::m.31871
MEAADKASEGASVSAPTEEVESEGQSAEAAEAGTEERVVRREVSRFGSESKCMEAARACPGKWYVYGRKGQRAFACLRGKCKARRWVVREMVPPLIVDDDHDDSTQCSGSGPRQEEWVLLEAPPGIEHRGYRGFRK